MKIKELFFSSHGIKATLSATFPAGLFSDRSSFDPINPLYNQFRRHILWSYLTSVIQLSVQSILATHLVTVSHSDHINLPCSQLWRRILWPCLTPVTSTRRVVNFDDFSHDPGSTHRIKYMSNKLGALELRTCATHLTYMLQLKEEC